MEIETSYIVLSIFMNCVLLFIGIAAIDKTVEDRSKNRNKKTVLLAALFLWQLYILIIGKSGLLQDYSLPPRVLIFLIFPAFLFIGLFLYKNKNRAWINKIPKHWLIFYQVFRIAIETLFVFSVAKGILPALVTIKGYNFDIVFAATAPIAGCYLYFGKEKANGFILMWNFLGLAVIALIIFLFTTSIYFPKFYGSEITLMPKQFGLYPYPLVPAFLMPSAVFIHILSIIQIRSTNKF